MDQDGEEDARAKEQEGQHRQVEASIEWRERWTKKAGLETLDRVRGP